LQASFSRNSRANQHKQQVENKGKQYTTELLNVLHVLTLLVEIEPDQAKLLEAICEGPTLAYRG
jgi:hypothetical protein